MQLQSRATVPLPSTVPLGVIHLMFGCKSDLLWLAMRPRVTPWQFEAATALHDKYAKAEGSQTREAYIHISSQDVPKVVQLIPASWGEEAEYMAREAQVRDNPVWESSFARNLVTRQ